MVTVSGNLKNLTAGAITSGRVRFELTNFGQQVPRVIGTTILPQVVQEVLSDANGAFSVSLYGNDVITPTNTLYNVFFYDDTLGTRIGPITFSITGSSVNLNTATPVAPGTPTPLSEAVLKSPTANQLISGDFDLTMLGGRFLTGNLNNTRIVDGYKFTTIQAAVNDLPASGGTVLVPLGIFDITSSLTINKPVVLMGAGTRPDTGASAPSVIRWTGSSGGTMLRINSGSGSLGGVQLQNLTLNANILAGIGIHATSLVQTFWENISLINLPNVTAGGPVDSTGILCDTNPSTVAGENDFRFSRFININVGEMSDQRPQIAWEVRDSAASPVSSDFDHNVLIGVRLAFANHASARGFLGKGSDNNIFLGLATFGTGANGKGVELKKGTVREAISNYFFHLQAANGMSVDATSGPNWVFGYDTTNGQPLPTVAAGGKLYITTDKTIGGAGPIAATKVGFGNDETRAQSARDAITNESLRLENNAESGAILKASGHANQWLFRPLSGGTFEIILAGAGGGFSFNATTAVPNAVSGLAIGGGAVATNHRSATGTLDFSSIAANTTAELTITVTGAVVGDTCSATPNGAPEAGLVWSAYVSSANTVTVRLGNTTTSSIDPASRSWRVDTWGH